jgi:hypothetical protein
VGACMWGTTEQEGVGIAVGGAGKSKPRGGGLHDTRRCLTLWIIAIMAGLSRLNPVGTGGTQQRQTVCGRQQAPSFAP